MLHRLPTRDRLLQWGLNVPSNCVLCNTGIETTNQHLFFHCTYAAEIWSRFCGRMIPAPPSDLLVTVPLCQSLQDSAYSDAVVFLELILQVIVYNLWRERNSRIFRGSLLRDSG